jgi:SPP1 gp7 family putative phage head morphogenesis protein
VELKGTFDPARPEGQRRALTVLSGFLNQAQQSAMEIDFYIRTTQQDARVRGSHAGRDGKIFRWDSPPERGHPTQDYGCRCYAQPLGIDGYWTRVSESVDAFTADIGRWEGNVDYMYLDSVGNVTVGKGKLLQDATSAADLPFRYRGSDELATEEDIRAEYDRIAGLFGDGGHTADYFEQFTDLYLPQSDIDHLVTEHMRGDFEPLLRMFPGFGNFPLSAQIALWDMIYNLGPSNLRTGFPRMRQAILDGDWEEAARQSHRRQPSEERNQYVFDLFMDSAQTP